MLDTIRAVQQEPEWAAFAAIDWADQQHTWTLVPAGSSLPQRGKVENTPEALHLWATALSVQFGGRPIAVCLEQCRGLLIYALSKYAHLVLFPVHPTTAARYRQTFSPSGAKDDPRDADSLLDLLLHHRDHFPRWQPDTVTNRHLQRLVEQRRLMVHEKTRQSNRLTACLKTFFPPNPTVVRRHHGTGGGRSAEALAHARTTAALSSRNSEEVLSSAQQSFRETHPGPPECDLPGGLVNSR